MRDGTEQIIVEFDGKKWHLPLVLPFFVGSVMRANYRFYRVTGYRPPRRGEYFLSGAIVEPYLALHDDPSLPNRRAYGQGQGYLVPSLGNRTGIQQETEG